MTAAPTPWWAWTWPVLAWVILLLTPFAGVGGLIAAAAGVALIASVMVAAPAEKAGLARDTVFAVVMIVCNGIVGLCLLWGGARHHEQGFELRGASAALAVLAALTT